MTGRGEFEAGGAAAPGYFRPRRRRARRACRAARDGTPGSAGRDRNRGTGSRRAGGRADHAIATQPDLDYRAPFDGRRAATAPATSTALPMTSGTPLERDPELDRTT